MLLVNLLLLKDSQDSHKVGNKVSLILFPLRTEVVYSGWYIYECVGFQGLSKGSKQYLFKLWISFDFSFTVKLYVFPQYYSTFLYFTINYYIWAIMVFKMRMKGFTL